MNAQYKTIGNVLFNDELNTFLFTDIWKEKKEMFCLTIQLTHFIYGYVVKTCVMIEKTCRKGFYMNYPRQDSTYHGHCYTSCGALAGT